MSDVKAIIFDCDGVLVDSEPISNGVLIEMAAELGATFSMAYAYKHFKGNSLKKCISIINEQAPILDSIKFEQAFRERSFKAFKAGIKPIAHVESLIKSLKMPYVVASSGPEHKIQLNLELTGLWPYFENRVYSCYSIGKWKPDPSVFLWAAKELQLHPEQCLVVEDSVMGIQAALAGGFKVCAYSPEGDEELQNLADFTIDDMLKLNHYL